MTKEIATLDYTDNKLLQTMKATVAHGLNNEEFMLFTELCKSTKLNPFKREIWAIKAGGRLQLMTGINGYWAIANAHPQFDGTEQEIEVDPLGNPAKAICKVYRKDRRFPSVAIALMKEYRKDSPVWREKPSVMLMKCAESVALRKAFPQELNGLYTQEEMPQEFSEQNIIQPVKAVTITERISAPAKVETPIEEKPYKYDGRKIKERSDLKMTWKIAQKEYGAVKDGDYAYTDKEIQEWEFALESVAGLKHVPLEEDEIPNFEA